jgi:hypothetical protein
MITKVGATAWRRPGEPAPGWNVEERDLANLAIDVTGDAERRTGVRPLDPDLVGDLTIVAHTVVHRSPPKRGSDLGAAGGVDSHGPGGGSAERAIVLAESAAGSRTVATSTDERALAALTTADYVGRRATVTPEATFVLG